MNKDKELTLDEMDEIREKGFLEEIIDKKEKTDKYPVIVVGFMDEKFGCCVEVASTDKLKEDEFCGYLMELAAQIVDAVSDLISEEKFTEDENKGNAMKKMVCKYIYERSLGKTAEELAKERGLII